MGAAVLWDFGQNVITEIILVLKMIQKFLNLAKACVERGEGMDYQLNFSDLAPEKTQCDDCDVSP